MSEDIKKPAELRWRLSVMMAERGIRTATELHRRLQPYDIAITSHQLTRIVAKLPERLNTRILAALLTELDCEASDLLRKESTQLKPLVPEPPKRKAPSVPESVMGPKVRLVRPKLPEE